MIDITNPGRQSGTLKVLSMEDKGEKMRWLTCEQDGQQLAFPIKQWKNLDGKLATVPAVDVEAVAEVEVKAGKFGNEAILESFGGATQQSGRGSGGGGGKSYVPKSREEFNASCVSGIIKSAIEKEPDPVKMEALAIAGLKVYKQAMKEYSV